MARILPTDKLWVCGQHQTVDGGNDWVMVGVYSSKEKAIDECEDGTYFIAPVHLDGTPDDSTEWRGYYRPLSH